MDECRRVQKSDKRVTNKYESDKRVQTNSRWVVGSSTFNTELPRFNHVKKKPSLNLYQGATYN